ncbi:MAG TPA: DEAD/DEAH box helicase [Phycisphaerae bacterium]|nr:DEAD/DEAH box helicase [Phycisphaerae bacterium]
MIATTVRQQLRDYQERAVEQVLEKLDRRPILVSPTGSGKTTMATEIVERLGVPTLWMAHRKELIDQAAERLNAHGLHAGILMAGYQSDPDARVQVASVQTLVRRNKPPAGLVIVDECHHAAAETYQNILSEYTGAVLIGLTATPFRLDGRGLGDLFGEMIIAAWSDELCDSGVLHKPRVWASKAPDLRGVRVVAGDYSIGALAARTNTAELNADIVETWHKRAAGRRTVAFAVDIEHSEAITEAFRRADVPAEHLDGTTPRSERDAILQRLADGETVVVSNCMVLTEGWDLPALECAIIARPTASLNLHLQMIGRVMRACHGKDGAIVLDHAGNHHVHGLVTRRLDYTLSDEKVGFSEPLGLRRCGQCGLLFETSEPRCPECGWAPEASGGQRRRPAIHGEGELAEFDDSAFEYRRQVWVQIEAQRQAAGYKPGWSYYRFYDRFGVAPIVVADELVNPQKATPAEKAEVYREYLRIAAAKGYKPGWAAYRFRDAFGHWPRREVA